MNKYGNDAIYLVKSTVSWTITLHEHIWKCLNLCCQLHCATNHYMSKYGNAIIYAITFTMSWTITRANMEVVIIQTEAFISSPVFICNFFANDQ